MKGSVAADNNIANDSAAGGSAMGIVVADGVTVGGSAAGRLKDYILFD